MERFDELREDNVIRVLLVEICIQDKDRPTSIGIQKALEKWKDDVDAPVDTTKPLTKSRNQFLQELSTDYFHCELQLYLMSFQIGKDELCTSSLDVASSRVRYIGESYVILNIVHAHRTTKSHLIVRTLSLAPKTKKQDILKIFWNYSKRYTRT